MSLNIEKESIRTIRIDQGWTQEKLAEVSGIHTRTIQRIENTGIASSRSLNALTQALGVSTEGVKVSSSQMNENSYPKLQDHEKAEHSEKSESRRGLPLMSLAQRQQIKASAKEELRIERWLTYKWVGWPVLLMGTVLTVWVLMLTQANLSRDVIFYVFFPGIASGMLIMLTGQYFIHLAERASQEQRNLRKYLKGALHTL